MDPNTKTCVLLGDIGGTNARLSLKLMSKCHTDIDIDEELACEILVSNERENEEKHDRININNINFSKINHKH